MVTKASEIGFLDTENGRGSLYADILDGQFLIADLYAPFAPNRYAQAIKEFQNAGVKVLVIDSVSHEWEGIGGCDDIANAPKADGTPRKVANWIGAKREHKAFVNAALAADMHIIFCIRAREKTDFKNPEKPVSLGVKPICEKNFMFEMTASFLVMNEGTEQQFIKIPAFLKPAFGNGKGYLGEQTGREIIKWVNLGEKQDAEVTKVLSEMQMICESGLDALTEAWEKLTPEMQEKIKPQMGVYKSSAKEFDKQRRDAEGSGATVDETKEQARIKDFIEKATDVRTLDQFENINLSDENRKLLTEKIEALNNQTK
jgi:hypothetical protein